MKLDIISKNNEKKGQADLPKQFSEDIRADIIKRAVDAEQSANRQPYGASPEAGMRHSVQISKRRHNYRGTYFCRFWIRTDSKRSVSQRIFSKR